jgi:hypothetical protein
MKKTITAVIAGVAIIAATGGCSSDGPLTNDNPAGNGAAYSNPAFTYADDGECSATGSEIDTYPSNDGTGITVEDLGADKAYVVGSVWITCNPPSSSQKTDVELYHDGNLVAHHEFRIAPGQDNASQYAASAPCEDGTWQVKWSAVGEDSLGNPYSTSHAWQVSNVGSSACENAKSSPKPNQTGDGPVVLD